MKNVSLVCKDDQRSVISSWLKNFNIVILSDTMNVLNVKLCIMILFFELYWFIPLTVTLTIFQVHVLELLFLFLFLSTVVETLYCCYIDEKDKAQYALCDWCVFKGHN